ncbi:MAG: hypothetical protein EHM70_12580 [Chloroflexota bacterium]|nr:MAG: hypothetical protein EHM70_12580 [Chloroflexota bacterium]
MPITVVLHIQNEDPVMGEVNDLPAPGDSLVSIMNPRRMDGKDLHYLTENVINVLWPVHRLNFIEIIPTREEEELIGFVRE